MSALTDQATRLRTLAIGAAPAEPARSARAARRAHVVAIASGKGGVGKTNIAVNLAIALADSGRETVIVDGDFGLGNADMLCGLTPSRHLGSVVEGLRSLDEVAVRYRPRLRLVPCGSGVASLADLDSLARKRFMDAFSLMELTADVLLLDCGAGLGPVVLDLLTLADTTFIISTPEPTSIADAYGVIKTMATRSPKPSRWSVHLVVNQASGMREAREVHARMAAVCDRFLGVGLPFAGKVSSDGRVSQSVRMRNPFVLAHPKADASQDVWSLSEYLLGSVMQNAVPRHEESLIKRLWRTLGGTD